MRGQLPGSKSLHSVLSWAIDVMQTPIRNESKRHSLGVVTIMRTESLRNSIAAIIVACTLSPAHSEEVLKLPADFVGNWWPISEDVYECPSPLPEFAGEIMLTISGKGYSLYEDASCDLTFSKAFENHYLGLSIRASFDCVGMGSYWNEEDTMYTASLGRQKLLVIATNRSTNERDGSGNRFPDDGSVRVGAWLKCEGPQ